MPGSELRLTLKGGHHLSRTASFRSQRQTSGAAFPPCEPLLSPRAGGDGRQAWLVPVSTIHSPTGGWRRSRADLSVPGRRKGLPLATQGAKPLGNHIRVRFAAVTCHKPSRAVPVSNCSASVFHLLPAGFTRVCVQSTESVRCVFTRVCEYIAFVLRCVDAA